jgi:hypothetical protein
MNKQDMSVETLVSDIQRGALRLPEMQRGYVWRSTQVRDLLDSLYRGYPSGNILVWETDGQTHQREMAVVQDDTASAQFRLLLDGQQRLTSLSAILRGETVNVRNRKKPIDILFNLEHPDSLDEVLDEEDSEDNDPDELEDPEDDVEQTVSERTQKFTFIVASKSIAAIPHWVSVTDVMKSSNDTQFLKKAGVVSFDDPRYEKYTTRLNALRSIRKYLYNVQILGRDLSYEEVTEVFVRVNSLGAKLRSSDLALAQITARWRGALAEFEEYAEYLRNEQFPLAIGTLVKGLVVHATGQNLFRSVHALSLDQLKDGWSKAKIGIQWAINYLRSNNDVTSPALLSSPYFVLLLSFAAESQNFSPSSDFLSRLSFWFRVANARGRYSRGSSETLLDQDLNVIKRGDKIDDLIHLVYQQFGRLHFEVSEMRGRTSQSPLFRSFFIACKQKNARDWNSGIGISIHNLGAEHKLQYHHIFPKATLKNTRQRYEIDDMANLSFISSKTNQSISAKQPQEYLPEVLDKFGDDLLKAQCIPLDDSLWQLSSYDAFLDERRRLIVDVVNASIGPNPIQE